MKKLDYVYVSDFYKNKECELLDVYINCTTKMKYRCKCGEVYQKTFDCFKHSHRCNKCRYLISGNNRRIKFDKVKKVFDDAGFVLLSKEYIGACEPMACLCSCGEPYSVSYHSVQQGTRKCPKCAGNKKLTIEYIKQKFADAGCNLLTETYTNAHQKLNYVCSCKNESVTSWANFQQGVRCKVCQARQSSEKQKSDFSDVQKYFDEHGCKLLESEYISWRTLMRYICVCGRKATITFGDFKRGHRCQKCAWEKNREATINRGGKRFIKMAPLIHDNKYDYSQVVYYGGWNEVKIVCPKHGVFQQHPAIHLRGSGCQKCNESSGEIQVRKALKELGLKFKSQAKFATCKSKRMLPFDLMVETGDHQGFLIEYQGVHHYQAFKRGTQMTDEDALKRLHYTQGNDAIKRAWCKERNIPLLEIPYWEKANVKTLIAVFLEGMA